MTWKTKYETFSATALSNDRDTDKNRGILWRYVVNEKENNESQVEKFST